MAHQTTDEIDLGLVFKKIGEQYRKFLLWLFHWFQFVLKHWIIILLIIILGAVAGYYWQKGSTGKNLATLIVQNNFDSTSYVYDALKLLKTKSKQGDAKFLKRYGFNTEEAEIADIEIEPIVNILDLARNTKDEDRTLEEYMAQTDFEDDILLSEVFYTEYKFHKVLIYTTANASNETIEKVIDYLNSNELLQEVRLVSIEETKQQIKNHEKSIKDIDGVFESYVDSNSTVNPAAQVYFKNNENNNLHMLLEEKRNIMNDIEELKAELIKYDGIVTVINKPVLHYSGSFFDNKVVLLPLFLVFLYFLFFALRGSYFRVKKMAEENKR
ncbi:MAG: hypothetical protein MK211_07125 [Flavobacteriales bacterium]|jgi:hypothetical protein|nr:hypothetical protein [Flavobacteriales bacterium]